MVGESSGGGAATLIIGAGPAGLAVAEKLRAIDEPFAIVERGDNVGSAWRRHYEALRLHTDRDHSSLPGQGWPEHTPRYPTRDQFLDYLQAYADRIEAKPFFGQEICLCQPTPEGWRTESSTGRIFESRRVVVATGASTNPHVPAWPGLETFAGRVLHSSDYTNGGHFARQRVLVVGFGNSAGEIAKDLVAHGADVTMSVRGEVNVLPQEVIGVPVLALGIPLAALPIPVSDALTTPLLRRTVGDLGKLGLRRSQLGPFEEIRERGRIPLIDSGTLALIRDGKISIRPGLTRYDGDRVVFDDGSSEVFSAVVLGTGFRPRLDRFLELPANDTIFDSDGTPEPDLSGRATTVPGLYLCGFCVPVTGVLREIGIEAQRIADAIERDRA